MQIYLDGIGLIKDSTVKLDGLTVITGENNSGKSTVGKALYAIVDGMIDIDLKQERDEILYFHDVLSNEVRQLSRSLKKLSSLIKREKIVFDNLKYIIIANLILQITRKDFVQKNNTKEKFISYLTVFIYELETYKDSIEPEHWNIIAGIHDKGEIEERDVIFEDFINDVNATISLCTIIMKRLEVGLNKDEFKAKYISYALQVEYNKEIHPVRSKDCLSRIELQDKQGILFNCTISNNTVNNDAFEALEDVFNRAFFIDNAYILDAVRLLAQEETEYGFDDNDMSVVNTIEIATHTTRLINYLNEPYKPNITFVLNDGKKYETVKQKINAVLPGTFNNTPQGLEYVEDNVSIKATNLATGSKMFAIIKMILDKYGLDNNTMLILDEPEAHLHPKWQNAFAEVIVILVKELGVNVLLTSHSPTFVLAIEAFMRKYEIIEKTNFYKTDIQEDGFVKYKLVNDDLNEIYEDFATYYGVVKYIREKYYGELQVDEREDI